MADQPPRGPLGSTPGSWPNPAPTGPTAPGSSGLTTIPGGVDTRTGASTSGAGAGQHHVPRGYGPDPRPPLPVGTVVAGVFRIESVLGAGGMGVVYRAQHLSLDRPVALKLHRDASWPASGTSAAGASAPATTASGSSLIDSARLEREAKAMARLNHPNVIGVYDVGRFGNELFIAMELVDGGTLRQASEGGPASRVMALYAQAAQGLAAAHDAGLVHRDFKPENVLVGRDGRVRVADFGLARASGAAMSDGSDLNALSTSLDRLTATGAVVGTPRYMAPEQFGGARVDARADQFSFCVALYEALWRRPPFEARTAGELLFVITTKGPTPPPSSDVPACVWPALKRGLSVEPNARHASMRALVAAVSGRGTGQRPPVVAVVVAAGAVLTCALGIGGYLMLRRGSNDTSDASATPPTVALAADDAAGQAPQPEPKATRAAETVTPPPTNAPQPQPATTPTPADDPRPNQAATEVPREPETTEELIEAFVLGDGNADPTALFVGIIKNSLPKAAKDQQPRVPAWDHSTTLSCGAGDNLIVRGATISVPAEAGPAFDVGHGCILRVENSTITADVVIKARHGSVQLNKSTVTARTSVADSLHSTLSIRDLTMTAPTKEPALIVGYGAITVIDSEIRGAVGIQAKYGAAVELEGGSVAGVTHAITASQGALVRCDSTELQGAVQESGNGRIEVRATIRPATP